MKRRVRKNAPEISELRRNLRQAVTPPVLSRVDLERLDENPAPTAGGTELEDFALALQRSTGNASSVRVLQRQTTPTLTDRDFPTDQNRRKLADAEARRRGKELNKPPPKGGEGYEPEKDPIQEKFDEIVGDPEKRLKALAKYNIPLDSEDLAAQDEKYKWEQDLQNGTAKINEYLDYIDKGLEYMEDTGKQIPFEPVAKGFEHVHEVLKDKVDVAHKWVKEVDQLREWVASLGRVGEATMAWDPNSPPEEYRAQAKKWVHALRRFTKASGPYVQWLKDHAVDLAFEGSAVAAEAAVVLPYVFIEFELGLKLLAQGIENEDAYFKRLDKIMKEIDRGEGVGPPEEAPPPPPGDFESQAELQERLRRRENEALFFAMRGQQERSEELRREAFEQKAFQAVYHGKNRAALKKAILADLEDSRRDADRWWDCLTPKEEYGMSETTISAVKDDPTPEEEMQEISAFEDLDRPCPYFEHVHEAAARAAGVKLLPRR